MTKTKVVLIDDDADFLYETGELMKYSVEKIYSEKPDVILLDVIMSVKNGLEIALELRKDSRLKHIPIIGISAMYLDNDFMGMCGIKEKLQKPFLPDDVIDKVEKLLRSGAKKTAADS